jgi:putative FmdB family regulatory protein
MPTYEYVCTKCHHHFEAFQSIASEPLKVCPVCRGELERLISGGTGLIFKGSGFYETDYKRKTNGGSDTHRVPKTETAPAKSTTSNSDKGSDSSDKSD